MCLPTHQSHPVRLGHGIQQFGTGVCPFSRSRSPPIKHEAQLQRAHSTQTRHLCGHGQTPRGSTCEAKRPVAQADPRDVRRKARHGVARKGQVCSVLAHPQNLTAFDSSVRSAGGSRATASRGLSAKTENSATPSTRYAGRVGVCLVCT